jgi:hypothetical protein
MDDWILQRGPAARSKALDQQVPHDDSGLRQIFPGLYHALVAAALDE